MTSHHHWIHWQHHWSLCNPKKKKKNREFSSVYKETHTMNSQIHSNWWTCLSKRYCLNAREKPRKKITEQLPVQSLAKSSQNSRLPAQTIYNLTTCLLGYLPDIAQCLQRNQLVSTSYIFLFLVWVGVISIVLEELNQTPQSEGNQTY